MNAPTFDLQGVVEFPLALAGLRGSHSHGTYVPSSDPDSIDDIDWFGVVVPPPENVLGTRGFGSRGTKELWDGPNDCVFYTLQKFIYLAAVKSNPNVLSWLWMKWEHYATVSAVGKRLIESRDLFITKNIFPALIGYAHGQLKRMSHIRFEGYMGAKRKGLVEKHGYDTKNAAHCIRLLRMGIEIFRDNEFHVWRDDAADLLRIKHGELSLGEVQKQAEELTAEARHWLDRSTLPDRPDADAVDALARDCHFLGWAVPRSRDTQEGE